MLTVICFTIAWGLVSIIGWNLWLSLHQGSQQIQRLHQIPCSNCIYFTGDYNLKCPVHPLRALTEAAIQCPDHQARI
jgi:hypothetical protein